MKRFIWKPGIPSGRAGVLIAVRKPSIKLIAEAAQVSVGTVSNVLNGKGNVSADIMSRVQDALLLHKYVRDRHAAEMRTRQSSLIGVIVPDLTNQMFAAFVSMVERLARRDNYDLMVVSSHNDPEEEALRLATFREWRPAGLILIPFDGGLKGRLPDGFVAPLVVADRIPDDDIFDLVAVDNIQASARVVRALRDSGVGDCLVLGTSLGISNIRERWRGAEVGAAHSGRPMRIELMEVGLGDRAPQELVDRLTSRARPRAVFCLDHETMLATYLLVGELGLSVPEDIALASFDEMEWMRLVRPAITAVRQPVEEMAESAWTMLCRRIAGDTTMPRSRRLGCAVTIRGSIPRIPARMEAGSEDLLTRGD